METDYGIEEFLGDRTQKIPCLLKELFTDFIVQEILDNGTVCRLPDRDSILGEIKIEEERGPVEAFKAPDFISSEEVAKMDAMGPGSKVHRIELQDLTKEQRTDFHMFVRNRYGGKLSSETKPNAIVISYHGVNKQNRKRKRWDASHPDYCHFTLAKENKDTSYALGLVSKFLGINAENFRTQGIKDRRAVTCQRVSCRRVEKDRLLEMNARLRDILLYDFDYQPEPVRMGGHKGNRFSIVLRNIPVDSEELLGARLKELSENGFINYFGTQRFGSCDTNTAEVGRLILKREWEKAVKMIVHTAAGAGTGTVGEAVDCFKETGCAKSALKKLKGGQSFASIEARIFRCLAENGSWQDCITGALPVNNRSLYVHAYQSLLWNKVSSRRIRENGLNRIADDLGANGKKLGENSSIFDVYIPLPGVGESAEENYVSRWYAELMAADEITIEQFTSLKDRFALSESTRQLLILPGNVEWKFTRYNGERDFLQNGLVTKAIDSVPDGSMLAVQVQFNLGQGVYATVALRQITGFDMGKKSMKEHAANLKIDANSSSENDQEEGTENGAAKEEVDAEA